MGEVCIFVIVVVFRCSCKCCFFGIVFFSGEKEEIKGADFKFFSFHFCVWFRNAHDSSLRDVT